MHFMQEILFKKKKKVSWKFEIVAWFSLENIAKNFFRAFIQKDADVWTNQIKEKVASEFLIGPFWNWASF